MSSTTSIADHKRRKAEQERDEQAAFITEQLDHAKGARSVNLEQIIRQIEHGYIIMALENCAGDLTRAALWLGYRTPDALKFLLKRHPDIKP